MTVNFIREMKEDLDFDYESDIRAVIIQSAVQEGCPYEFEVNITFTDDEGMRNINREYRELDAPTDVLSFPLINFLSPADFTFLEKEEENIGCFHPETGELMLGDIIISVERAKRQALEYGHSLRREICFLTAHSMLHLFGYDHVEDEERKVMESGQERILQSLGIVRD